MNQEKVEFKPIKQKNGGSIHLSIYYPGKFINNKGFLIMVGGCGYGEKKTLEDAKKYLLSCAIERCEFMIKSAQDTIKEYQTHRNNLIKKGLEET